MATKKRVGRRKTLTYSSWLCMRERCNNPAKHNYRWYGAKGIRVCKAWDSFDTFVRDMGIRPKRSYTLGRINHAIGYYPGNCRWLTPTQQRDKYEDVPF
jgi:hypothetical protein